MEENTLKNDESNKSNEKILEIFEKVIKETTDNNEILLEKFKNKNINQRIYSLIGQWDQDGDEKHNEKDEFIYDTDDHWRGLKLKFNGIFLSEKNEEGKDLTDDEILKNSFRHFKNCALEQLQLLDKEYGDKFITPLLEDEKEISLHEKIDNIKFNIFPKIKEKIITNSILAKIKGLGSIFKIEFKKENVKDITDKELENIFNFLDIDRKQYKKNIAEEKKAFIQKIYNIAYFLNTQKSFENWSCQTPENEYTKFVSKNNDKTDSFVANNISVSFFESLKTFYEKESFDSFYIKM